MFYFHSLRRVLAFVPILYCTYYVLSSSAKVLGETFVKFTSMCKAG